MPGTAAVPVRGREDMMVNPPHVLVVDDDDALRRMLRLTLRGGGFDVELASNGRSALDCIDEQPPDAVVLDLEMPEMDGRQFYRELRGRGIDVPVLIVSAYGARAARRELGAQGALDKPFDPDDLVSAVREML